MEETKNLEQILAEAREAFEKCLYTKAAGLFEEAAALSPENTEAPVFADACHFLAGEQIGQNLLPVWEKTRLILERVIREAPAEEVFAYAQLIKRIMSICTAAVYRSSNDRQKVEYAALNKEVKLENKEFIFDEIRRVLLEADEEYKAVLKIMYEYAQLVYQLPHQELAEESFFVNVIGYMQMAVDLQQESGLQEPFAGVELAEFACRMKIGEGMTEALNLRNTLLKATLQGADALEKWDFFGPYAEAAGISRLSLEKRLQRKAFLEKLKFWKKLKIKK